MYSSSHQQQRVRSQHSGCPPPQQPQVPPSWQLRKYSGLGQPTCASAYRDFDADCSGISFDGSPLDSDLLPYLNLQWTPQDGAVDGSGKPASRGPSMTPLYTPASRYQQYQSRRASVAATSLMHFKRTDQTPLQEKNAAVLQRANRKDQCQLSPRDVSPQISKLSLHNQPRGQSTRENYLSPVSQPSPSSRSGPPKPPVSDAELTLQMMDRQLALIGFDFSSPKVQYTPEQSVFQKWKILSELGSGTFAKVLRLQSVTTGEIVAGKLLEPYKFQDATQPRITELFAKEIKHSLDCQCPSVLEIKKVIRGVEGWILVQEFIDGGTLWHDPTCTDEMNCFSQLLQLIQAVICMQSKRIVHRDLKPTNLLRTSDKQRLYVTDFGWSESLSHLNCHTHELPGTIEINPPELIRHSPTQTEKIDNYAIALIMLLMISSKFVCRDPKLPIEEATEQVLKGIHLIRTGTRLKAFSKDAWDVFLGLSRFNPRERYSMAEVIHSKWFVTTFRKYLIDDSPQETLLNRSRNRYRLDYMQRKFVWHVSLQSLANHLWDQQTPKVPPLLPEAGSGGSNPNEKYRYERSDKDLDALAKETPPPWSGDRAVHTPELSSRCQSDIRDTQELKKPYGAGYDPRQGYSVPKPAVRASTPQTPCPYSFQYNCNFQLPSNKLPHSYYVKKQNDNIGGMSLSQNAFDQLVFDRYFVRKRNTAVPRRSRPVEHIKSGTINESIVENIDASMYKGQPPYEGAHQVTDFPHGKKESTTASTADFLNYSPQALFKKERSFSVAHSTHMYNDPAEDPRCTWGTSAELSEVVASHANDDQSSSGYPDQPPASPPAMYSKIKGICGRPAPAYKFVAPVFTAHKQSVCAQNQQ